MFKDYDYDSTVLKQAPSPRIRIQEFSMEFALFVLVYVKSSAHISPVGTEMYFPYLQ